ncbi:MAG: TonB-dependent receptor [Vannielia sp.]|uniref:TonB-dependent receptor plug domain-containing protein n=1 Tax=Vannielia sp. TaxID=2813045 RepID=UPI003B8D9AEE
MNRLLATGATLALATATPLAAQQVYDLDTITVTADLSDATDTAESGATVEVTTRDDLEKAGDNSVATYLSRQPGISLASNGGPGALTNIRIRGLSQNYVSVRWDGIDITDVSGPQVAYDFGRLSTSDVGRIEVLKGSQSAQYGSEAVAGVVSLGTRRATEDGTQAFIEGEIGTYNTFNLAAGVTTRGERGELGFTLSRQQTDGFSIADGGAEDDGYSSIRLSFYGEYKATEFLTLGINGFAQKSDADLDGFGPVDDLTEETPSDTHGLRAFADWNNGTWSHRFELSTFQITSERSYGTYVGEREEMRYLGTARLSGQTELRFGADHTTETFTSDFGGGEESVSGLFAEIAWQPSEALDVLATLRHDEHDTFGGYTTGRVALAWSPREDLILRGSAGTGFRAPSLYELNDGFAGNLDLVPEESFTADIGIEKKFAGEDFLRATLFYSEIDKLIIYGGSGYEQSDGTATAWGLELSGQKQLSDAVVLFGNYTYTEAENADGSRQLNMPRHDLLVGIEADLAPRWKGRAEVQHVADLISTPSSAPTKLDDYTLVNASVTYEINDMAEAYLRVENLTDQDYQTVTGFGQSGRAVYVGLRARF